MLLFFANSSLLVPELLSGSKNAMWVLPTLKVSAFRELNIKREVIKDKITTLFK